MTATTQTTLTEAAIEHAEKGLSIVPVGRDKRTFTAWKHLQTTAMQPDEIRRAMSDKRAKGFAVIGGEVSGGLEIIDFDVPGYFEQWRDQVDPDVFMRLPIQRTGGGGHQVAWRRPNAKGNQKLAHHPNANNFDGREVAIETRGEGGYAVVPPSAHPSGGTYAYLTPETFGDAPMLTAEDAEELLDIARGLCTAPETKQQIETRERIEREGPKPVKATVKLREGESVIDAFNRAVPIKTMLERAGYTLDQRSGEYTRPGEGASPGGVVILDGRSFHHSTNDPMHSPDKHAHDSFGVFAFYEQGNDTTKAVKAAARELGMESKKQSTQEYVRDLTTIGSGLRNVESNNGTDWPALAGVAEAIAGETQSQSSEPLDPATPYDTAMQFIADRYGTTPRRLHHWRGDFYLHDGRAYAIASKDRLRAELYRYVAGAFAPTKSRTANLIDAAMAAAYLPEATGTPSWLGDATGKPKAFGCVSMANGILHLPKRKLYPHDPALFTLNALSFDFDPAASCPHWLAFIKSIWPDDPEQAQALQEWIGYLLSGDTGQQKIALLIGPKRSGKGTIARVMAELLGRDNVCAPTLAGLATNFGLQPLIGKTAATISDARLGGRADQSAIAERLLSISGEDGITIDRKHTSAWTGKLGVRFTIMSNELPRLADASGALASRFVVMMMSKTFYGREDAGLTDRLLGELPGIFNWALEGLDRLANRGRLQQPETSEDAIAELAELGSPVGAFVAECCVVGEAESIRCDALYQEWSKWCADHGRSHPGTAQSFGRDLRAAVAGVGVRRTGGRSDRIRIYEGIRPID